MLYSFKELIILETYIYVHMIREMMTDPSKDEYLTNLTIMNSSTFVAL